MKAKFIELISTPSGHIKIVICAVVVMLVVATITGIVNGIKDGIRMTHAMMGGVSAETLIAMQKREAQQRKEEQRKHFKSTLYCILHPLDFIDFKIGQAWHTYQEKKKNV